MELNVNEVEQETLKEEDKLNIVESERESEDMVEEGVHNYSSASSYVKPTEPRVLKQLEWFQDQKLALMMHWGPYSQVGLVESWALSDQDADWARDGIDWDVDGETFKQQYFDLNKTFNPIRFQPEKWADAAKDAGFKYFIFTTKHHDGFCMWDTKYSDYKITGEDCPFHTHKYADICANLFESFRKRGLGIAAYFSKADWHIPSYWNPNFERGNFTWRGPSYDPSKYPEIWEEFAQYTQNQILELATNYGKIDILWFDAGWVCKEAYHQDIRLGEVIDKIRQFQPWVLSADRTIGGAYENYVTPEQCVPDKPIGIPWESCITMGTSFSFKYEDKYKTPREIANLLVDIVAKGGNLALNVGPQPDGRLPEGARNTMKGLGEWMRVYGEAIYGTRVCAPYKKDGIAFTRKENTIYAFKMYENETDKVELEIKIPFKGKIKSISMVDSKKTVEFKVVDGAYLIRLPEDNYSKAPIGHVLEIKEEI
jgi:alpha-L-fucosidase